MFSSIISTHKFYTLGLGTSQKKKKFSILNILGALLYNLHTIFFPLVLGTSRKIVLNLQNSGCFAVQHSHSLLLCVHCGGVHEPWLCESDGRVN